MIRAFQVALLAVRGYLTDRGDLAFSLLLPIAIFALMYGAFGGQDMFHGTAYVVNEDEGGAYSVSLLEQLNALDTLDVELLPLSKADIRLERSDLLMVLYIPEDFSDKLASGDQAQLVFKQRGNGGQEGQIVASIVREIFGLVGPNGAGKTTTIRMLSTVLEPDRGDVTVGGYLIRQNAEEVRSLIGVCPQELALYEDLSALDNMIFFGRMAGLNGKEARAQSMAHLELMGLTERARGKISKFSGGMKRRVNLAIALMGHPELLFLDEPTVGIDPQSRNNIYETIEGLRDGGMTILYTTHYMEEADRLCDRVAIMDGGQIIAMDTPFELKSQIGPPEQVTLEDVFLKLTGRSLRD